MAFGKPGRPAEDRLVRQREIYEAVSPLILETGARYLSMRAAARAACLSVGGLYHHFPTKRDLVLHGIQYEVIARYCQEFHDSHADLVETDPAAFLDAYVGFITVAIAFIRPAFHAAIELGLKAPEDILEPTLAAASDEFTKTFRAAFPGASEEDIYQAGRAIHRSIVAALLDKTMTAEEFRKEVLVLINGYFVGQDASSPDRTLFPPSEILDIAPAK
jgi:AcrR family transcriptional regulator